MPKEQWKPPEAGDAPQEVKDILKKVYAAFRDEHPGENPATKAKGAKIAWGAVHNAGWSKGKDGKWTKAKYEHSEEETEFLSFLSELAEKRKDVSEADKKAAKEEYGDVAYADEENKKYPIDTEEHIRAAWNYINKEKNAAKYPKGVAGIKAKIIAAWKKKIDKEGPPSASEHAEVEIDSFKAGKYPQGEFTGKELSEIAESYDPEVYEAPITIGHLSDYKGETKVPAFGWIGKVKVVGDHLKLIASQFSDQLKAWYQEGLYKKVSAAFFQPDDPNNPTPGKWHLHHLAFLGGKPPAVKGLEGIAFAELSLAGVEMAEQDASVTGLDEVEALGTQDTYENIQECFAVCLSKIEEALTSEADDDVIKQRMGLALSDCYAEIQQEISLHFAFVEKLDSVDEAQESEMSEHKSRLVELANKIMGRTKRKEQDAMDTAKIKEFEDKIAAQEAKIKEFAEKERVAAEAKAKAEQDAADEKLRTEIKEFCEALRKEGKYVKADDEAKLPEEMFKAAKAGADYKKLVGTRGVIVPVGEMKEFNENKTTDTRSDVIKSAEQYVKDHPKEFAELDPAIRTARAVYLHSVDKIKFPSK